MDEKSLAGKKDSLADPRERTRGREGARGLKRWRSREVELVESRRRESDKERFGPSGRERRGGVGVELRERWEGKGRRRVARS